MIALAWTLIVLFALGAIVGIAYIGKPRPVTTPGAAIFGVLLNGLMIAWIAAVML